MTLVSPLAQAFPRALCAVTVADFPGRVFAVTASYSNAGHAPVIRVSRSAGILLESQHLTHRCRRSHLVNGLRRRNFCVRTNLKLTRGLKAPGLFHFDPRVLAHGVGQFAESFQDSISMHGHHRVWSSKCLLSPPKSY